MSAAGFEKTEFDVRTIQTITVELQNDTHTTKWYSQFARIGFVKIHKMLVEDLEKAYRDTQRQLFQEQIKSPRNEGLIIRLKTLQIEQGDQLEELALGNPVIAALKAKLDKAENKITK